MMQSLHVDPAHVAELVRARSGLAGHDLAPSDVDRFLATIARLPPPPASVLDVGCGTGVLVDVLGSLGYEATGLDPDAAVMGQMEQPHMVGSADALPAEDRAFEVLVLNEVLEHLPVGVFEDSLVEAARVADRRIVVTVPNAESLESASTRCRACGCVYSIHGHVRRFDRPAMRTLFGGFDLVSLDTVGPYKLRHRTVEWYLRRRLLGRWPSQPNSTCPQCGIQQPGRQASEGGDSGGRVKRALISLYAVPWSRWWMVATYERPDWVSRT